MWELKTVMRLPIQSVGATLLIGLATCLFVAANPESEKKPAASLKGMSLPEYDPEGRLRRPTGYEKWVLIGTSIGLGYSDSGAQDPNNPGMFHNVYLQPEAFDHFVSTGEFPEQSVFVMTNNRSQPAKTLGPVSRSGFVAAPTTGLEIAIKDSQRFPDSWAYFIFPNKAEPPTARAFDRKDCYDCHAEHAQTDNVFTQFYSVLTEARQKQMAKGAASK